MYIHTHTYIYIYNYIYIYIHALTLQEEMITLLSTFPKAEE